MGFRISGLVQATRFFQQEMAEIISSRHNGDEISLHNLKILELHKGFVENVHQLEGLCAQFKATPADLPNPSYHAFQWLRFLSEKKWLLSHLHGLAEFQDILKQISPKHLSKIEPAQVQLEIKNFNYLYRCKQNKKTIRIEINEGFICAPKAIKELLLTNAIGGKSKKANRLIKEFTTSANFRKISKALQSDARVNQISHKGRYFDLEGIFGKLNLQYFDGKLSRPRLSWSPKRSVRRLGYYHPESDAITISRSLDSEEVNHMLVEYILYHEMLHKALGIRETNGRRYAHTREFFKAEKKFEGYEQAQKLMHQFSRKN